MLIIRLVKGLNVAMLPYLETAGAWLLDVARARMLIRSVTGASHSYRPSRIRDDGDDACTPFQQYDRNAVQSRSVSAMLRLMRLKGFLSSDHRNCERLRNVFSSDPEDLHDSKTQELILTIDAHGRKSAELHSASIFPDIFGRLSDSDIKKYFNGKRFRGQWTRQRQIPTCGTLMENQSNKNAIETAKLSKNPRKALTDRRHPVTKLMTSLTLAEHSAIASGDYEGAEMHGRGGQRYILLVTLCILIQTPTGGRTAM